MRIFLSNQNRDLRLTIRKPITLNQFPSSQKFQKAAMVDNVLKRLTIRKPIRSKVYGKIQIKKKKSFITSVQTSLKNGRERVPS